MHRLAWRSLLAFLPVALAACPASDDVATTVDTVADTGMTTTGAVTSSTTVLVTTTGPDDTTSEEGSSSSTSATSEGSSSTGPAADSGDTTGEIAVCGNNKIEGNEVCDLAQVNGETCQSLGYQGGQLGCLLTCEDYNLLGCFICGNEVIDIAEDCEGGVVPEEVTCVSLGYEAGDVTCGADCLYDTAECSICGDGIQQGPENCDGIDFDGQDCVSLGFDGGNLACNLANCSFNFSGCSGGQYVQDFEGGVMPAQFTGGGNANWVVDNMMPIAGGFSAHSGVIGHSQQSHMNLTVNMAVAGTIAYSYKVSSEGCCDYLRFYVDGVLVPGAQWSGAAMGAGMTNLAAGMHTLSWRYTKDGSVVVGSDRAWVDDIVLVGGVPL